MFPSLPHFRNTRSGTDTNRNTRRRWTCHPPSSYQTSWSQTRLGHSSTPHSFVFCGQAGKILQQGCLVDFFFSSINPHGSSSSSLTHPDLPLIFLLILVLPVPLLLVLAVLPFRSTIIFHCTSSRLTFLLQTFNSSSSGGGVNSLPAPSQKRMDDGTARFTTANFQEVSSALSSGSSKDSLAADTGKVTSEAKNKKNSSGSHTVGQRGGRKSLTSSGKPLPSAVVTMATSSTSASVSTGPFHQGELIAANGPVC